MAENWDAYPRARTLHFASATSIGRLVVSAPEAASGHAAAVPAAGDIVVQEGGYARLYVDNLHPVDLGSLDGLGPHDLQALNMVNAMVTDEDLAHLVRLSGLRELDISRTPIGDAGAAFLRTLTQLRSLTLDSTFVGDEGLAKLSYLTSLEFLSILGTRVTDEGVRSLSGLRMLRQLVLSETGIKGHTLEALAQIPMLSRLHLARTEVGDWSVPKIARQTALSYLDLSDTLVSDASVERLAQIRSLRVLDVSRSEITSSGALALQSRLPGCRVVHNGLPATMGPEDLVQKSGRRGTAPRERPDDFFFRVPRPHIAAFLGCLTLGAFEAVAGRSLDPRGVEVLTALGFRNILRDWVPSTILSAMRNADDLSRLVQMRDGERDLAESLANDIANVRDALSELPPERDLRVFWEISNPETRHEHDGTARGQHGAS